MGAEEKPNVPNVGFPSGTSADLTPPPFLLVDDFSFCNSVLRSWRIASAIVESCICLRVVRLNCHTHMIYQNGWTPANTSSQMTIRQNLRLIFDLYQV